MPVCARDRPLQWLWVARLQRLEAFELNTVFLIKTVKTFITVLCCQVVGIPSSEPRTSCIPTKNHTLRQRAPTLWLAGPQRNTEPERRLSGLTFHYEKWSSEMKIAQQTIAFRQFMWRSDCSPTGMTWIYSQLGQSSRETLQLHCSDAEDITETNSWVQEQWKGDFFQQCGYLHFNLRTSTFVFFFPEWN